jgi:hypothetical protein
MMTSFAFIFGVVQRFENWLGERKTNAPRAQTTSAAGP